VFQNMGTASNQMGIYSEVLSGTGNVWAGYFEANSTGGEAIGLYAKTSGGASVRAIKGEIVAPAGGSLTISSYASGIISVVGVGAGDTIQGEINGAAQVMTVSGGTLTGTTDWIGNQSQVIYGHGTFTLPHFSSYYASSGISGGATVTTAYGYRNKLDMEGTATTVYGFHNNILDTAGSGTVTDSIGYYDVGNNITNTTNAYHIFLAAHTTGTNKWGIYQAGANDQNYFSGDVTIGTTTVDSAKVTILSSASRGLSVTNTGATGIYTNVTSTSADLVGHSITVIGGASLTSAKGINISCTPALGATDSYGIYSSGHSSAGTIVDAYHIYLSGHGGGVTNKYGIYQVGTGDSNEFYGRTAFGTTAATDKQVKVYRTGDTGDAWGIHSVISTSSLANNNSWARAVFGEANGSNGTGLWIGGHFSYGNPTEVGTVSEGIAVMAQVNTDTIGTDLYNVYGFFLESMNVNSGDTVNSVYSLFLSATGGGGTVNNQRYGIFQAGANDLNVLRGNLAYDKQVYQENGVYDAGNTGTSLTLDFDNGNVQKCTMNNASITIANPSNAKDGAVYTICFIQDATASRTISTWGANWNWGDAGAPDFSGGTTSGDKFYVTVVVNGTELDAIYSGVKH